MKHSLILLIFLFLIFKGEAQTIPLNSHYGYDTIPVIRLIQDTRQRSFLNQRNHTPIIYRCYAVFAGGQEPLEYLDHRFKQIPSYYKIWPLQ